MIFRNIYRPNNLKRQTICVTFRLRCRPYARLPTRFVYILWTYQYLIGKAPKPYSPLSLDLGSARLYVVSEVGGSPPPPIVCENLINLKLNIDEVGLGLLNEQCDWTHHLLIVFFLAPKFFCKTGSIKPKLRGLFFKEMWLKRPPPSPGSAHDYNCMWNSFDHYW